MHFNSKLVLSLLITVPSAFAAVNGKCNGRSGICINTTTCNNYNGQKYSGKCPNDPNNIKCCDNIPCKYNGKSGTCMFTSQCNGTKVSGLCPGGNDFKCCIKDPGVIRCNGVAGTCIDVNTTSCKTQIVTGKCPGASNIRCCLDSGTSVTSKPSWYVDQTKHTEIICSIPGSSPVNKSVKSSGCGVSCLSMAINVLKNVNVTPETLFREGYNNGKYKGDGFSHDALTYLGGKHGVSVSWTGNLDTVYSALQNGKPVIFHTGPDSTYHFTSGGHYILLYGAKTVNGIQKVYVFDPNGKNNHINELMTFRKANGGIEVAKRGTSVDFGIVSRK